LGNVPSDAIDRDLVRGNTLLFHVVASALFIEITSGLYTRNLVGFFRSDAEVVHWLEDGWEKEEVHHGLALRRYLDVAWLGFDWGAVYRGFSAEYHRSCSIDRLSTGRVLEMAARCVVETGTSSFYRMLAAASPEPALVQIASSISADEVRHYKHFYCFFRKYRDLERPRPWSGVTDAAVVRRRDQHRRCLLCF
jgi:rubrerythrin